MWPDPPETLDLVKFTEEMIDGKLHFLCNAWGHFWGHFCESVFDIVEG